MDYETATSHTVEVTATSTDGSTSSETFTINLTDDTSESSVGPVSDSNAAANAVDEDASVGAVVGITALATDPDVTDTVTYSLTDNAGGLFAIDANTGIVTVAGSLDAETAGSHTIEVTATSTDGSTSTQSFTIDVNDVNETAISAVSDVDAAGNTVAETPPSAPPSASPPWPPTPMSPTPSHIACRRTRAASSPSTPTQAS